MHEAKSQLSRLAELAWQGQEIVICKAGEPYLRLELYRERLEERKPGGLEGQIWMSPDFDETPRTLSIRSTTRRYSRMKTNGRRMFMNEWPLQDAKNKFSAMVDAAVAGEPQRVTRRGKPAVVVLAVEEYERLCRLEKAKAPTFADLLLAIPQDDEEFERLQLPSRPVDF